MRSRASRSLRSMIERTLATASLLGLALVTIAATMLAYHNAERTHEHGARAIHHTIGELAAPALAISDYSEVIRVLGLVSGGHELIAVITQNGDLLLPDYQKSKQLEEVVSVYPGEVQCRGLFKNDLRRGLRFLCTEIGVGRGLRPERPLGVLVTTDIVDFWSLLPTVLLPMVVIALLSTALVVIAFRHIFNRRVLAPFEALVRHIREATGSPLAGDLQRFDRTAAPAELRLLEDAWISLVEEARRQHEQHQEMEKRKALYDLARQIAHDIRGPVLALKTQMEMAEQEMSEKTRRRFSLAVARIQEIAQQLLAASRTSDTDIAVGPARRDVIPLVLLAEELIAEKCAQYAAKSEVNVSFELYAPVGEACASVNAGEFKRVLSNLVDNSVEALTAGGDVIVSIEQRGPDVLLKVRDTGRGIAPDVLPELGVQGASFFKKGGSGLGLYHARTQAERWGGQLLIESTVGVGTVVALSLPKHTPPAWLAPAPDLDGVDHVVVLDDDAVMHQVWRSWVEVASQGGARPALTAFSDGESLAA
jgi:signal transduction histidine kinase